MFQVLEKGDNKNRTPVPEGLDLSSGGEGQPYILTQELKYWVNVKGYIGQGFSLCPMKNTDPLG